VLVNVIQTEACSEAPGLHTRGAILLGWRTNLGSLAESAVPKVRSDGWTVRLGKHVLGDLPRIPAVRVSGNGPVHVAEISSVGLGGIRGEPVSVDQDGASGVPCSMDGTSQWVSRLTTAAKVGPGTATARISQAGPKAGRYAVRWARRRGRRC